MRSQPRRNLPPSSLIGLGRFKGKCQCLEHWRRGRPRSPAWPPALCTVLDFHSEAQQAPLPPPSSLISKPTKRVWPGTPDLHLSLARWAPDAYGPAELPTPCSADLSVHARLLPGLLKETLRRSSSRPPHQVLNVCAQGLCPGRQPSPGPGTPVISTPGTDFPSPPHTQHTPQTGF